MRPLRDVIEAKPLASNPDHQLELHLKCGHVAVRARKHRNKVTRAFDGSRKWSSRLNRMRVEDPWPKRVRCGLCALA